MCLIDEQGLISAQGGIYQKINKRTGPNHYYTVVPNKSAQGGFFFQKKISDHGLVLGTPEYVSTYLPCEMDIVPLLPWSLCT